MKDGIYRVDGKEYNLPQHGLARVRKFELVEKTDNKLVFELPLSLIHISTVTNIYKGAQWFEEEIQEMMPLKFEGLIFSGRLFLPEEFKEGEGQILIMPLNELKKLKDK